MRRSKWLQMTLGVLVVLLAREVRMTEAYQYDESSWESEDEYATPEVKTSTHWWDATASADADEAEDTCSCGVHTYAWAKTNDSAEAYAGAAGAYRRYWTWNGPPGTAPGGILVWGHDGQGSADIEAYRNDDNGQGNTSCAAYAWSMSGVEYPWGSGSSGTSYFFGIVEGAVENDDLATGDPYYVVTPGVVWMDWDTYGGYGPGQFDPGIAWAVWDYGGYGISAGTAEFSFLAGAQCDSESEASVAGVGALQAWSQTYAAALIRATTTFTSNP